MDGVVHIGEAARLLGVTPEHLRALERQGRVLPARRDFNGRIYSRFDIALLRSIGVGMRPRRLRQAEEVLPRGSEDSTRIVCASRPDVSLEQASDTQAS